MKMRVTRAMVNDLKQIKYVLPQLNVLQVLPLSEMTSRDHIPPITTSKDPDVSAGFGSPRLLICVNACSGCFLLKLAHQGTYQEAF